MRFTDDMPTRNIRIRMDNILHEEVTDDVPVVSDENPNRNEEDDLDIPEGDAE